MVNDLFDIEEPIASIEIRRGELLKQLTDMGYNTVPIRKEQVEQLQESVDLALKQTA